MSDEIEIEVPLTNGKAIRTVLDWPQMEITLARDAKVVDVGVMALKVATEITEGLVADILPLLPPAAPGHKVVERDATGRISGVVEYPPTLPPAAAADQIRQAVITQLLPMLGASMADAIRAKYAELRNGES